MSVYRLSVPCHTDAPSVHSSRKILSGGAL
jgi:hypothetical protein